MAVQTPQVCLVLLPHPPSFQLSLSVGSALEACLIEVKTMHSKARVHFIVQLIIKTVIKCKRFL